MDESRGRTSARRRRLYAAAAAVFFLLAVGAGGGKAVLLGQPFDLVVSDGRYYYVYLPSAVIDHDLDFGNQIQNHWGTDFRPELVETRNQRGLIHNKYPVGVALTLLPAFLLGHLVALASGGLIPADGYAWPYQLACLGLIELLVWRTLVRIDDLLVTRFGVPADAALWGVLVVAFGTPYAFYAWREPFMAHALSAYWCTVAIHQAANGARGPAWLWPRLGFSAGMAAVCRPTNAFLLPVIAYGVWLAAKQAGWRRTLLLAPLGATAFLPVGVQLACWKEMTGAWVTFSYGNERFIWGEPALFGTLFSSRHGLFFWAPVLLLAVPGLARKARDPLAACWLIGAGLLWYANSAWHVWWFGDAFGARSFLELTGLFALGLAAWFAGRSWGVRLAVTGLAVAFNTALMGLYISRRIPRGDYLLPWF